MLASVLAFGLLWLAQTPAPAHHSSHAKASTTVSKAPPKPTGPKSAAELQTDLEAALRAALSGDQVSSSVAGKDITLRGEVHSAEHKGVATRTARKVAEKDGWGGFHVLNQIDVNLSH